MKAALAIAAAQFRAYRMALWGGILMGLMGHLLFMIIHPGFREQLAAAAGLVTLMSAQLCLAVVLGAGAVSSDLAERRLGFYLARPVSPLAYWAGKMAAAFLVAYVAGWLVLLPGFLVGAIPWAVKLGSPSVSQSVAVFAANVRGTTVLVGVFATAFFVAVAGVAAGAVRSRSGLLLLDVVMLGLTGTGFVLAIGSTWDAGTSPVVLAYGTPWLLGIAMLVIFSAGAVQVCLGRLDLRRGHVLLSTVLWSGLLACVAGVFLFSRAVASVTPADLRLPYPITVDAPRTGTHVLLEGVSSRWGHLHAPAFFLDAQGQFTRAGGASWVTGSAWSADGRRFAWSKGAFPAVDTPVFAGAKPLRAVPGFTPSLWIMRLDQPGEVPGLVARRGHELEIVRGVVSVVKSEWGVALRAYELEGVRALSPSGQRLLIASTSRRGKSVVDVDSGHTVASIAESPAWSNARFLSETAVRALRMGPAGARIVEWDLAGDRLTERGAIALQGGRSWFTRLVPTDDWQRVLRFDGTGLFLHDLDGRVVATLVDGWPTRMRAAGVLSGGRFGSVEEGPEGLRLRVFDADGRPRAEALIKGRFPVVIGGESAPGLLALGVAPFQEDGVRETLFIDLATGDVARREPGQWPALRRWQPGPRGESANPEPGSLATRLFLSDEGLVLLDPASGGRKVLVQRRTS